MGKVDPNRTAKQKKERRLVVVADLYAKGYSFGQIINETKKTLGLETYSKSTLSKDINCLKAEWKETRIADMDDAINHELYKINIQERELWEAWEKSKADQKITSKKQKGSSSKGKAVGEKGIVDTEKIITTGIEKTEKEEINYGDPRYMAELTKLGQERRKLTGIYAPEKKEVNGEFSFYGFLQANNTVDE